MKKNIIALVAAVAAQNPEGFTINAANLQPVAHGYAVALAETQNSFGNEGLAKVVAVIDRIKNEAAKIDLDATDRLAFGGWYDLESGLYYYDATLIIKDRQEAIELGRKNGQIAIFDLDNLEEIRL